MFKQSLGDSLDLSHVHQIARTIGKLELDTERWPVRTGGSLALNGALIEMHGGKPGNTAAGPLPPSCLASRKAAPHPAFASRLRLTDVGCDTAQRDLCATMGGESPGSRNGNTLSEFLRADRRGVRRVSTSLNQNTA